MPETAKTVMEVYFDLSRPIPASSLAQLVDQAWKEAKMPRKMRLFSNHSYSQGESSYDFTLYISDLRGGFKEFKRDIVEIEKKNPVLTLLVLATRLFGPYAYLSCHLDREMSYDRLTFVDNGIKPIPEHERASFYRRNEKHFERFHDALKRLENDAQSTQGIG